MRGSRDCESGSDHDGPHPISRAACAIPVGEERRNPQPEHQHERQMHEHRDHRRAQRQALAPSSRRTPSAAPCENTAANATPSASEQERRRPRLLAHRGGEDQELAREDAERRHAEDRQRAEHQPPAERRADRDQAADVVHDLRAGLLRRVADGEEDRRLGQRMHGHVQQRRRSWRSGRPCRTRT